VEITGLQELEQQLPPPASGFQAAHGATPATGAGAGRRQRQQHAFGWVSEEAHLRDVHVQEMHLEGAAAQQQTSQKKRRWIIGSLIALLLLAGLGVGLGLGVGE
jgi:hypothetical protein